MSKAEGVPTATGDATSRSEWGVPPAWVIGVAGRKRCRFMGRVGLNLFVRVDAMYSQLTAEVEALLGLSNALLRRTALTYDEIGLGVWVGLRVRVEVSYKVQI